MGTFQLDLFDLLELLGKRVSVPVDDYYMEFQSVGSSRRRDAGYGGDPTTETYVRKLIGEGNEAYAQWRNKIIGDDTCRDLLHELIVQLWCVRVKGELSSSIYSKPASPKVYTPHIVDDFTSFIPEQLILPKESVLLACFESYVGNEQDIYHVIYFNYVDEKWYNASVLYDHRKRKWSNSLTRRKSVLLRADLEYQRWTQAGFDKAKDSKSLDPQIAAVWTNYIKFYGRDDALARLGLNPAA